MEDSLQKQEQVLNDNRDFLIKYLDPDDISDQLIQEGMLGKIAAQRAVAEEVVDMRGGSVELTQTYFYSLVR